MQLLAGTDAGTGVRGHVGVWGAILLFSPTMWAGQGGGEEGHTQEHTHTHTGTYTRMLHLPFSNLPLQRCPNFFLGGINFQLQIQNCAARRITFHYQRQISGNFSRKSLITDAASLLNSN